ncbi:hypothetical protein N801_07460 [Knoellia aerolata DSM 18566]|uniref:Uncharacterized protein n=1 Tax=Knoellia aerolata DSM 18566 TaxID=1385519 RepID=A0A0A0JW02_9MICO|nr:hypothetical protein N801_07460 [Knoellia aerolata DSM 18566]
MEVRCGGGAGPVHAAAMREAWSRCLTPHDPTAEQHEGEPVDVSLDDPGRLAATMQSTTQDVTRALIGARAGQLLMFHAGAVSDPLTGATLVLVARGGTGKTTLTRLLGERLGYVTDETVGIDANGAIHPYPKPLSVRRPDEPRVKDELSPDTLALAPAPTSPRVSRLVLLERKPGHRTARVEELAFMDAVFALAEQSSSLHALPKPLTRLADLIDDVGPVIRLHYGEAADATSDALGLLGVAL